MLDLHRLRLLRELHERGTIAAVAEALRFTPSAVSQQLAVLERETGVRAAREGGPRGAAHRPCAGARRSRRRAAGARRGGGGRAGRRVGHGGRPGARGVVPVGRAADRAPRHAEARVRRARAALRARRGRARVVAARARARGRRPRAGRRVGAPAAGAPRRGSRARTWSSTRCRDPPRAATGGSRARAGRARRPRRRRLGHRPRAAWRGRRSRGARAASTAVSNPTSATARTTRWSASRSSRRVAR